MPRYPQNTIAADPIHCVRDVARGCDEDALASPLSLLRTDKFPGLGRTYRILPAPGLHAGGLQSEPVLFNDTVDTTVAASPHNLLEKAGR